MSGSAGRCRCVKPSLARRFVQLSPGDRVLLIVEDDVTFARYLVRDVGVAVVPGSSFYHDPALGRDKIRFCFAKRRETLERGGELLGALRPR